MSLSSYLTKRPNSQFWQLRMMVPAAARPTLRRTAFTRSLGLTDRRRAEEAAYPILADWKAKVAAALPAADSVFATEPTRPTDTELEELALVAGFEAASVRVDALISAKARLGVGAFEILKKEFERRYSEAVRQCRAGELQEWSARAKRSLKKRGWQLHEEDPAFVRFVRNFARCGADAFAHAVATLDGKEDVFQPSSLVVEAQRRRDQRARPGETILALYDDYSSEKLRAGKKRPDTLAQDRKAIELFTSFIGEHRSLSSITVSEVREWRNALAALPPTYRKKKAYKGLSMKEAAARAKSQKKAGLSLLTVNKQLSALSALMSWAKGHGHVDSNPCDGLFYAVDKQRNKRPPFSPDQLNKILSSPLFCGFERDGKEHVGGKTRTRDWRFWIPLICLFTGARIGEIAQLHVGDIEQHGDNWIIRIRHDERAGQTTKSGTSRMVPVHSKLRAIGFLAFVARTRKKANENPDAALFPELSLNERNQNGRASRFWRDYLRRIGLKDGADGFGAHSFRHGLADQLRSAGLFDSHISVLLGHSQRSVTGGYGQLRQSTAAKLNEMIEEAKFPGVDFSPLMS